MSKPEGPGSEARGLHRLFAGLRTNFFHSDTDLRERMDGRVDGILRYNPDDNHRLEQLLTALLTESLSIAASITKVNTDPKE